MMKPLISMMAIAFRLGSVEPASGALNRELAQSWLDAGAAEEAQARFVDAEQHYRRAAQLFEQLDGPDAPGTIDALARQAGVEVQTGRYSAADARLQRCLAARSAIFGSDSRQAASSLADLGFLRIAETRYAVAEPLLRRSLAIYENIGDRNLIGALLSALGWALYEEKKEQEALETAARAWAILEGLQSPPATAQARALVVMGLVAAANGDLSAALARMERAVGLARQAFGAGHPAVAYLLSRYSQMLSRAHRRKEAKAAAARSQEILNLNRNNAGLGLTVDIAAPEAGKSK
jgi:tetratricopeptide (TPR) repeat protein